MMKHNKKRNTAFIYEALVQEFTKTIIDPHSIRKLHILSILKEFFSPHTVLGEELNLYRILLETHNLHEAVAEKLLKETKLAYTRLDEKAVFGAQSRLIAAINKKLGQETWQNFIPNFKSLASVNAIFNSKVGVKKRVLFEQALLDKISHAPHRSSNSSMKPIDNLAYHSFIKKFNSKYGELLGEQKELLNRYITSFADDGFELRLYLNEELSRLKGLLSTPPDDTQSLISQKVTEVVSYLEGFRRREFTDEDLEKVLTTQALVQELTTDA